QTVRLKSITPVAHQAASSGDGAILKDRRLPIAECQRAELFAPTDEEGVGADHKRSGPQLRKTRKHNIEVAFSTGMKDLEFEPERTSSRLSLFGRNLGQVQAGRIDEQGYDGRHRYDFV